MKLKPLYILGWGPKIAYFALLSVLFDKKYIGASYFDLKGIDKRLQ